jgi:hypothetical protein
MLSYICCSISALTQFFSSSGMTTRKLFSSAFPPLALALPGTAPGPTEVDVPNQDQPAALPGKQHVQPVRVASEAQARSRERGSHYEDDDIVLPALKGVDRGRRAHPEEGRKLWHSLGKRLDIRRIRREDGDLVGPDARLDQVDGNAERNFDLLRALL